MNWNSPGSAACWSTTPPRTLLEWKVENQVSQDALPQYDDAIMVPGPAGTGRGGYQFGAEETQPPGRGDKHPRTAAQNPKQREASRGGREREITCCGWRCDGVGGGLLRPVPVGSSSSGGVRQAGSSSSPPPGTPLSPVPSTAILYPSRLIRTLCSICLACCARFSWGQDREEFARVAGKRHCIEFFLFSFLFFFNSRADNSCAGKRHCIEFFFKKISFSFFFFSSFPHSLVCTVLFFLATGVGKAARCASSTCSRISIHKFCLSCTLDIKNDFVANTCRHGVHVTSNVDGSLQKHPHSWSITVPPLIFMIHIWDVKNKVKGPSAMAATGPTLKRAPSHFPCQYLGSILWLSKKMWQVI
jgi:hypothetical protein